jgi:hypothetical protein
MERTDMFQIITTVVKWASLPLLLIGSILTRFAASYELRLDVLICLAAVVVVQRAVWVREYFWATEFVAIAIVFSPLTLVIKIFFFLALTCVATFAAVLAAWKPQLLPARLNGDFGGDTINTFITPGS